MLFLFSHKPHQNILLLFVIFAMIKEYSLHIPVIVHSAQQCNFKLLHLASFRKSIFLILLFLLLILKKKTFIWLSFPMHSVLTSFHASETVKRRVFFSLPTPCHYSLFFLSHSLFFLYFSCSFLLLLILIGQL